MDYKIYDESDFYMAKTKVKITLTESEFEKFHNSIDQYAVADSMSKKMTVPMQLSKSFKKARKTLDNSKENED